MAQRAEDNKLIRIEGKISDVNINSIICVQVGFKIKVEGLLKKEEKM